MNPKESTEPMSIDYTPGPLLDAARNTPPALWNDSAAPDELRPSISRSRARRECRWRRERKAGRTRTEAGTSNVACRPAMPSGPITLTVNGPARRSPRRRGVSTVE